MEEDFVLRHAKMSEILEKYMFIYVPKNIYCINLKPSIIKHPGFLWAKCDF